MKKGQLDEQEFLQIKEHTRIGEKICQPLRTLKPVLPIIRSHHERHNGSGYPDGLKGEQIPQIAQIIALVDCYDAMTTTRPYRAAMNKEIVITVLRDDCQKGLWNPTMCEAFLDLVASIDIEKIDLQSELISVQPFIW
jgi:putative two-component system response regulator